MDYKYNSATLKIECKQGITAILAKFKLQGTEKIAKMILTNRIYGNVRNAWLILYLRREKNVFIPSFYRCFLGSFQTISNVCWSIYNVLYTHTIDTLKKEKNMLKYFKKAEIFEIQNSNVYNFLKKLHFWKQTTHS